MAYPYDSLAPHEQLILKLHPHWWYITKAAMALVFTVVVGSIVAATVGSGIVNAAIAIVVIAEVIWFVERFVRWTSIFFVLTSDRVMSREGIIAKRGIEIPLARINTVVFRQRIFERLLGLGTLVIESASTDGSQTFRTVRQPDEIQKQIYIQMESGSNRQQDRLSQAIADATGAAPAVPAAGGPAVAEQINELAALRDQGHLTEAEFQRKKNELLDRM